MTFNILLAVLTIALIIMLLLYVRLYLKLQIQQELSERRIDRYNVAIEFARTLPGLEADAFWKAWLEGDWRAIQDELPLFDVKEDIKLNQDLIKYGKYVR